MRAVIKKWALSAHFFALRLARRLEDIHEANA
ncbi:MAG: Uncharacterised protein [Pseudidiomarina mangrovi]|nr:MAG: Uncharacterised protein [Pseudidiomarina mangrovi]